MRDKFSPALAVQASRHKQNDRLQVSTVVRHLTPGIVFSGAVAVAAVYAAPLVAVLLPIPSMVLALVIGIALHPIATRPTFQPGIMFCVKTLLRWAVALLGLRIALGEIANLGLTTAALVVVAMTATIVAAFWLAPWGRMQLRGSGRCRHRSVRRLRDPGDLRSPAGLSGQGS